MIETRERITDILTEVGKDLLKKGIVIGFEICYRSDVHAFYKLTRDGDYVIHVQGYPGMSDEKEMHVSARLRYYWKMMKIRMENRSSVGNEHEANYEIPFKTLNAGIRLPYNANILEQRIMEEWRAIFPVDD